jgi:exopolysaccharide production protein ExoY
MTISSSQEIERLRKLKSYAKTTPLIFVRHDPFKRAFDIVFSLAVLTVLSPLFLLLVLLILCTSPGAPLYKGRRLGRGGKVIECWKFRTMYKDADERLHHLLESDEKIRKEWSTFRKIKKDPRITPIGHFLRKTSMDELPQFFNVIKGDLSVVGPRAPALFGPPDQFLQELQHLFGESTATILSVRPGITGVWQISGRSQIGVEEKIKMEEHYAKHRSFKLDLILILKTIPAVLFSRGAF